jgi:hypothetical protein
MTRVNTSHLTHAAENSPCERCSTGWGRPLMSYPPDLAATLVAIYPVQRFAFLPKSKYCEPCLAALLGGCPRCKRKHIGLYCHVGSYKE